MRSIFIAKCRSLPPIGLISAVVLAALGLAPATASALTFGLDDPGFGPNGTSAQTRVANEAMTAIDGSVVRIGVRWARIAPARKPAHFDAANPADPHYNWRNLDFAVRDAAGRHLKVLIDVLDAPKWAQGSARKNPATQQYVSPGAWDPNPADFAQFIHAAAVRYSGSYPDPLNPGSDIPRINYWEPWNEPNIPGYFSAPHPVDAYRTLLDSAYYVLKRVHKDNVVVLGGLAPISPVPGSTPPLTFGADLLCLHAVGGGFRANRSCRHRTSFDVFAVHPYSLAATPTKHAYKAGDDLVADMSKVGLLVRSADRLHTTAQRIHHPLWVTEWAWLTNPPDPQLGDPDARAARYVAYSLYTMWRSGAGMVIWQQVLDSSSADFLGGGLYFSSGRPKLTLWAFAFPFVASVSRGKGFAWGRVPTSHRLHVVIQRATGSRWISVAQANTLTHGVFTARFRATGNGRYRAIAPGGPTSLAYYSAAIPPRRTH